MKKFFVAVLVILLSTFAVNAAVETYEGVDEYYVLGAVENINVARERARERAIRDAREKAGVYIHTVSKVVNMKLVDDEIISVASGVLRVVDTAYEVIQLTDMDGYLIRATVKADIDTGDLDRFLEKDAEELANIVAKDKVIRQQEHRQDQRIETLKQEYRQAETPEQKEIIAAQIVVEDKIFLSNVKLREGNRYRDEGDHKQAEKLFTEAIELNPDNALAWHNRAWAYIDLKRYQQAINDFNKASALNPNWDLPYFGRGWIYNLRKEYASAIAEYDKAIALNPKYPNSWNNRGAAKSWLNQMREAIADYDKAIELKPNYVKAYENRGKAYGALGDNAHAAEDLNRAAKIDSSNKGADKIIEESEALVKRGNYTEALNLLNKAAELFPDNQFVFVNRGNLYNDNFRDFDKAIADYNKTIALNDKFSWPYHNRAIALGRLKRWDEAIADYGRAIELNPTFAAAYNGRAWAYCQIGNFEAALVDADKALELMPNEANYFDTRATAYASLGRFDDALADMNKAIKLSPEGWLYHGRGKIYKLMGDEAKAKSDFDKAKQLGYTE